MYSTSSRMIPPHPSRHHLPPIQPPGSHIHPPPIPAPGSHVHPPPSLAPGSHVHPLPIPAPGSHVHSSLPDAEATTLHPASILKTSSMHHSPSLSSIDSHHHSVHTPRIDSFRNPDTLYRSGPPPPPASRSDARRWNKKVFAPDAHSLIHTFSPHNLGHAAAYQAYRIWKRTHDPAKAHMEPERHRDIITEMALQEVMNLFSQYPSLNQLSKEEAIQHATATAAHFLSEITTGLAGGISPSSTVHSHHRHSPRSMLHSLRHRSLSRGRGRSRDRSGHIPGRYLDPRDDYDLRQPYASPPLHAAPIVPGSYPRPHPPAHLPVNDSAYSRGLPHRSHHIASPDPFPGDVHSAAYPPYDHPYGPPHIPLGTHAPDMYLPRGYDHHGRGRSRHRSHSISYGPAPLPPFQHHSYQPPHHYAPSHTQTVSYLNTGNEMIPLPPGSNYYMPSEHHDRHRSSSRHGLHRHRSRDHSRGRSKLRSKSRRKYSRSRSKHHHGGGHRSSSRHHHYAPRSTSYDPYHSSTYRYY